MNPCQKIQPYLDDYLDQELNPEKLAEFEHHIARCPDCRSLVDKAQRIHRNLENLGNDMPVDKERIWNHISTNIAIDSPAKKFSGWSYYVAAAAMLLIVISSFLVFNRRSHPKQENMFAVIDQVNHSYMTRYGYFKQFIAEHPQNDEIRIILKNLKIINHAMAEIESVLRKDPSNISLVRMFLEQHQVRMELMQQMMFEASSEKMKGEQHEI